MAYIKAFGAPDAPHLFQKPLPPPPVVTQTTAQAAETEKSGEKKTKK